MFCVVSSSIFAILKKKSFFMFLLDLLCSTEFELNCSVKKKKKLSFYGSTVIPFSYS